ncbi:hypothetical protein SAMN05216289_11781 [Dokdonella immobilis]|uniref:Uncharacterized protein n=2 Tax=Dokdonella immobilis TaxID=578942 RepID=A0A1I4YHK0_9GAMM|nr:hypothetical protein SAMN05216289_11781 [Dokdonella immobilis]
MAAGRFVISSRYCGPPGSGNGGYVCGRLAAYLRGPASVRLKAPPPLETGLDVESSDAEARLKSGANVIAEARSAELDLESPTPPSFAEAEEASKAYIGFTQHPFPGCFVCGPQREMGDGLRIFPGWVASGSMVASPWVPDASLGDDSNKVRSEFLWAALDCTSGFAVMPAPQGKAMVLGELGVRIDRDLPTGEKCVALGWPLAFDGRKRHCGSAIFSGSGDLIAIARATWIEVESSAFGGQ